jgi:hypothetical protein
MRHRLVLLVEHLAGDDIRYGEPLGEEIERVSRKRGEQTVAPMKVGGL